MTGEIIGQRIGSYRVVRKLGEGGMGAVFEAVHDQIGRQVAIKVLHPELSQSSEIATRFLNEARAVSLIRHPSIVYIFEYGRLPDGSAYIIMEYLVGDSIRGRLKQLGGRLGANTLRITRQIASTLAAAHEQGIVHRDLKPDNVMLVVDPETMGGERVKVLDFGIAKVGSQTEEAYIRTRTGAMMGTPAYMAPEQCRGAGEVNDKADVYSLGVMLYQFLVGQPPFVAEGAGELIAMHLFAPTPAVAEVLPGVHPDLQALIERMLEKKAEQRPTMTEAAAALTRMIDAQVPVPDAVAAVTLPAREISIPGVSKSGATTSPDKATGSGASFGGANLNSTLGQATGQNVPPAAGSGRRLFLLGGAAAAILLVGGGVALTLRSPATVQPPVPLPPVEVPKPVTIHWLIRSTPSGAMVVDAEGTKLGVTPLALERDRGNGALALTLTLAGYRDFSTQISRAIDDKVDATLAPLVPPNGRVKPRPKRLKDADIPLVK